MQSRLYFEDYSNSFEHVRFSRDDTGVLEMVLHSDGGSLVWTAAIEHELGDAFRKVAADPDNAVVLMTGAGDAFIGEIDFTSFTLENADDWSLNMAGGTGLINSMLSIEVPVVAAVNGPALIHSEIAILSDITVASDTAVFQDGHFSFGVVPGDGGGAAWLHALGPQRGRYFLLTAEELSAEKALDYDVVNEVVSAGEVLPRARELATAIAEKPDLARRYTRMLITHEWRRWMHDHLNLGIAHEAIASLSAPVS